MNYPKKQFKGVWIDKQVWEDQNLTWLDKCLLAEIWSLSGDDGCYASNEFLASKFGVTEATMKNKLSAMRKRGYLRTVRFDGRTRWMKVSWDMSADVTENMTPEDSDYITSEVTKNVTHHHIVESKGLEKSLGSGNDHFFDDKFYPDSAPIEVVERIVDEAIGHGLPEEGAADFLNRIKGKHFKIRPKSDVPGLEALTQSYLAQCFED